MGELGDLVRLMGYSGGEWMGWGGASDGLRYRRVRNGEQRLQHCSSAVNGCDKSAESSFGSRKGPDCNSKATQSSLMARVSKVKDIAHTDTFSYFNKSISRHI